MSYVDPTVENKQWYHATKKRGDGRRMRRERWQACIVVEARRALRGGGTCFTRPIGRKLGFQDVGLKWKVKVRRQLSERRTYRSG